MVQKPVVSDTSLQSVTRAYMYMTTSNTLPSADDEVIYQI